MELSRALQVFSVKKVRATSFAAIRCYETKRHNLYPQAADIYPEPAYIYPQSADIYPGAADTNELRNYNTTFTILKTDDEVAADTSKILADEPLGGGSVKRVDDVPEEYNAWAKNNQGRIEQAKSLTYFLRDNTQEQLLTHVRYAGNLLLTPH